MSEQDDRIKWAADSLQALRGQIDGFGLNLDSRAEVEWLVRKVLAAADAPPKPAWPTAESIYWIMDLGPEYTEASVALRAAMLTDPIIERAVELSREWGYPSILGTKYQALYNAVRDAGLLDGKA